MKLSLLLFSVLLFVLTACQPPALNVGNQYMDAVKLGDADAMIAVVSDDMTMVVDGGPIFHNELTGAEALREYLKGNAASGFQFELTGAPVIEGNRISFPNRFAINDFRQIGVEWVAGADVVTTENGKVVRDVWTIDNASIQELAAAFAALQGLTVDKLVGTWRWDGGEGIGVSDTRYNEDGTYELVRYISGGEVTWDVGVYAIEGDNVTLTTSEAHYCKIGDRGVYQVMITEDGKLENTPVEDFVRAASRR